jgi:hypothetical protein
MFRSPVVTDPPTAKSALAVNADAPEQLVPLSVVALDLPAPADWSAFLADRGIKITIDDIGRAATAYTSLTAKPGLYAIVTLDISTRRFLTCRFIIRP